MINNNQVKQQQSSTNLSQVPSETKVNEAKDVQKEAVEHKSIETLPKEIENTAGILVYENAKKKLDISNDGKIYRQKWFNYMPFISVISILVYVNYIFGKTKCLKDHDFKLFKKAYTWCNIIGFLIMPLVGLALWTFGTWMVVEVIPGEFGNYSNIWSDYHSHITGSVGNQIGQAIGGLFTVALTPLTTSMSVIVGGATIPLNLIFIAVLMLFTIINPVNIIYTFIMNARMLRFVTVHESSAIYRYRK